MCLATSGALFPVWVVCCVHTHAHVIPSLRLGTDAVQYERVLESSLFFTKMSQINSIIEILI